MRILLFSYTNIMKKNFIALSLSSIVLLYLVGLVLISQQWREQHQVQGATDTPNRYWFLLHRASNKEYLYRGLPGKKEKSMLLNTFEVKTGQPGERPTPLPQLAGKEYWLVTGKRIATDNETAPYFLTLNVPYSLEPPYGPVPYEECNGQCNWTIPGEFGLHGVNNDLSRLSKSNPGSSGCVRHKDEDIAYLYNLLDPAKEEIRYYIQDI